MRANDEMFDETSNCSRSCYFIDLKFNSKTIFAALLEKYIEN